MAKKSRTRHLKKMPLEPLVFGRGCVRVARGNSLGYGKIVWDWAIRSQVAKGTVLLLWQPKFPCKKGDLIYDNKGFHYMVKGFFIIRVA